MVRLVSLFLIILTSCGPRYVDFFPYHDDGTVKPKVILTPIEVKCEAPAYTSDALNNCLRYELMNSNELYLYSPTDVRYFLDKTGPLDINRKEFKIAGNCDADFLVIIELFDHGLKRLEDCRTVRISPCIRARVKIVDIRGSCSKVIMFQYIDTTTDAKPNGGCTELCSYQASHKNLCKKIAERLECVIRSVK